MNEEEQPTCLICLESISGQDRAFPPCGYPRTLFHKSCLEAFEDMDDFHGRCPHCNISLANAAEESAWKKEIKSIEKIQQTIQTWLKPAKRRFWKKRSQFFNFKQGGVQTESQEKRVWRYVVGYAVNLMHAHKHVSLSGAIRVTEKKNPHEKNIICRNEERHYEINIRIQRVALCSRSGGIISDGYQLSGKSIKF